MNYPFMPHGHCMLWDPGLLWLHVGSDLVIAFSYFAIPAGILYALRYKKSLDKPWLLSLFAAFILLCGMTHMMAIYTLWTPAYWFEGWLKLVTAIVSLGTALCMPATARWVVQNLSRQELEELYQKVKQRESVIKATEKELRERNQDLEVFAHAASHDLRAPLRTVSSFLELLEEENKDKLDEDSRLYIDFAVQGARRMDQLVIRLMEFARAGTVGLKPTTCDLDELLDQVEADLSASLSEAKATVERGPLPKVQADRTLLTQVFQNLLANALKFRGDEPPLIRVAARAQADQWRISVEDNGTGIHADSLAEVVKPFKRVHDDPDREGSGLGLSICAKIVEKHGGRLWPESVLGEGTTFHFTLPRSTAE